MQQGWSQQMLQGWMGCAGVGAAGSPWDAATNTQCLSYNVLDKEREFVSKLYLLNKKMHHWNNISIKNEYETVLQCITKPPFSSCSSIQDCV